MDRRTRRTNARKSRAESTPPPGTTPASSANSSTCRMNSRSRATMSEAQSIRITPGTTRLSGFTAKSVSAMLNWAIGLRAGARNACIQKRTSAASTKSPKIVSSTKVTAVTTIGSLLSERLAQLARAGAGGLHGLDEMGSHLCRIQHLHGALRGAALGGHLGTQLRRLLPALDRELRGAHERPESQRPRRPLGEAQLARRLLQRFDRIEDVSRAASGN